MATSAADISYVRLLIGDNDPANQLLTDTDLDTLISRGGSVLYGAADALDAIATSEALLSKKITSQDLATDGPAVAASLHQRAVELRARADTASGEYAVGFVSMGRRPRIPEGVERPDLFEWWLR